MTIVPQTNLEDPGATSPTAHVGTEGPADSIMASQENPPDSIELSQSNSKPRPGRPTKEKTKLIEKATEDLWKLIHDLAVSLQWPIDAVLDRVRKGLDISKKNCVPNAYNEFQAMMKHQMMGLTEEEKSHLPKNNSTSSTTQYHKQKDQPLFGELIESFTQVRQTDGNNDQTVLERKNKFQKTFDKFTKKVLTFELLLTPCLTI